MKKEQIRKSLLATALSACLILVGCGAPGTATREKEDAIRFLSSDSPYGSGNESGYYYFTSDENGNSLLRFVDYATLQDVVLCGQPNCAHRDENCPAWFAWNGVGANVLASGDSLYILSPGAPWSDWVFDTCGEKALPRIIKCGPDGSDRQELVRFGAAEAISSMPAVDGKNLYTVVTDYGAADKAVVKIVTVDLATGAVSADESVQRDELRIVGAWGRELILQSGTGRNYYTAYNVDTKALRDLDMTSASAAVVSEGALYCVDETTGVIRTVSLKDGSVTELQTDLLAGESIPWLMLANVTEQGYVVQAATEEGYCNLLVDFEGETTRQTLQADSTEDRDNMRMLEIFARQGQNYLVSPSRTYNTVRTPASNGATYGEDIVEYAFALISAEDFWNSTPNYRAVTRVG